MVKIILIRGAAAVGKTTITKELLKILKNKHHISCAYICEDNFRKEMQFKYKAKDLNAHQNSVEIIKTVIIRLLELDTYDIIFIEGQFRYKEVLDNYFAFISKNDFESILFQFGLDLDEMKRRDIKYRNTKSKDIEEIKKDIDSYTPSHAHIIHTGKQIDETIKYLIKKIV